MAEVENLLLQAFWRGDLRCTLPGVPAAVALDPRVRILNSCRWAPQDAGLLCVDRAVDFPPETEAQADGSLFVDSRRRIVWPAEAAAQTPELLAAASRVLAGASWDDYHDLTKPVLAGLEVEREAFADFCRAASYPLPAFWFKGQKSSLTVGAETRLRAWLRECVAQGSKEFGVEEYRRRALAQFPGLSERGFARVWKETVPPSWQAAGRPRAARKSSRRVR